MDTRSYIAESLVLKGRDYGEADRILIIFTREKGKISAIAKSSRKSSSHLRGVTQLFSHSRLSFAGGKNGGLATITQGETIDSFFGLREDFDKIAYASYLAELVDCVLPEGKPQEGLFILLTVVYTLLEAMEDAELIVRYFELKMLSLLGYRPQLKNCVICDRALSGGQFLLAPSRGGIVCASCNRLQEDAIPLSNGAIATMDRMFDQELAKWFNLKVSPAYRQELEPAIAAYMAYYLERTPRAKEVFHKFTAPY